MDEDIGRIPKDEQTDIVLRIDDFGGKKGLTIREYVRSERYTGFTKAGIKILAEDFPKFKELINFIDEGKFKEDIIPKEILDVLKKKVDEATPEELDEALEFVESKLKEIKEKK